MSVPQEAIMLHHEPKQFMHLKRWMKMQMEPLTERPGKITFPQCLSAAARRCGHQVAGSLKLKHDSCGDGASRCLVVFNDTDLGAEQPSLKRKRAQESIEERANPRAKAARMRKGKAKGEDKGNGKVGKGGKDQKARSKSKGQGKGGKDEEEVVMLEDMWVPGDSAVASLPPSSPKTDTVVAGVEGQDNACNDEPRDEHDSAADLFDLSPTAPLNRVGIMNCHTFG